MPKRHISIKRGFNFLRRLCTGSIFSISWRPASIYLQSLPCGPLLRDASEQLLGVRAWFIFSYPGFHKLRPVPPREFFGFVWDLELPSLLCGPLRVRFRLRRFDELR